MNRSSLCFVLFALTLIINPYPASALPTLNVVGGQLYGASGVDVNGTMYDVSFLNGTLYSIFGTPPSFTFTTQSLAIDASEALLNQVLLDTASGNFDSQPELTNGLELPYAGYLYTPFAYNTSTAIFSAAVIENTHDVDTVYTLTTPSVLNFWSIPDYVYARWTQTSIAPVPEPSTIILLGIGLGGLVVVRRRKR